MKFTLILIFALALGALTGCSSYTNIHLQTIPPDQMVIADAETQKYYRDLNRELKQNILHVLQYKESMVSRMGINSELENAQAYLIIEISSDGKLVSINFDPQRTHCKDKILRGIMTGAKITFPYKRFPASLAKAYKTQVIDVPFNLNPYGVLGQY